MLWIEERLFNIGRLKTLLQSDDSAPWESIFQIEIGKLLFQGKDLRITYAFAPT